MALYQQQQQMAMMGVGGGGYMMPHWGQMGQMMPVGPVMVGDVLHAPFPGDEDSFLGHELSKRACACGFRS